MKEYCIYIRQGLAKPYVLHTFNNINSAKIKLFDMISLEDMRGRPYFVDNDFFDNKFNMSSSLRYFCIKEREVTDWIVYSSKNDLSNSDNILYLNNFKK